MSGQRHYEQHNVRKTTHDTGKHSYTSSGYVVVDNPGTVSISNQVGPLKNHERDADAFRQLRIFVYRSYFEKTILSDGSMIDFTTAS
jgi:hypothetical protein